MRARMCVCVEILRANKNAGDTLGAPPRPQRIPYRRLRALRAGLTAGVGFKKKPSWKMPSLSCFSPSPSPADRFNFLYKVLTTFPSKSCSPCAPLSFPVTLSRALRLLRRSPALFLHHFTALFRTSYYYNIRCPLSLINASVVESLPGFQSNSNAARQTRKENYRMRKLSYIKAVVAKCACMFYVYEYIYYTVEENYPSFNQDKYLSSRTNGYWTF